LVQLYGGAVDVMSVTTMMLMMSGGDKANAWDISTASLNATFALSGDILPRSIFFKPDGTKMYVVEVFGDSVDEYDLSSNWHISTASFAQSFVVNINPNTSISGISFKPDGTKMYVIETVTDVVLEYNLGTDWDVTTASLVQSFGIGSEDSTPVGLFFKPDGTKMYTSGDFANSVYEYSLSSAWDVTSASYIQSFSVATQDSQPRDIFFKPDGSRMYLAGSSSDSVYEYSLSTTWDISSMSFVQGVSVVSSLNGLFFRPDGERMYVSRNTASTDAVVEYKLG
jgi:DNA-binding beta-propeller fold protein YncE